MCCAALCAAHTYCAYVSPMLYVCVLILHVPLIEYTSTTTVSASLTGADKMLTNLTQKKSKRAVSRFTEFQVLEYHPEPWDEWLVVGHLQTARAAHAALSIGHQQLPCLSGESCFRSQGSVLGDAIKQIATDCLG